MMILGLNSGTSMDGISAALFKTTWNFPLVKIKLICSREYGYPAWVKEMLREIEEKGTLEKISRTDFLLGEIFAEAALRLLKESRTKLEAVDLIASHGQTIGHFPRSIKIGGRNVRATAQIGEANVIAQRTGITSVGDFRPADIAAGGEGAPVLAYPEYLLFASKTKNRMVLNLGGIANFSLMTAGRCPESVLATDAGPCNLLLDGLVKILTKGRVAYDRDGKMALKGRAREEWSHKFMQHKFFTRPAPKTAGREDFNEKWIKNMLSKIAFKPERNSEDVLRSAVNAVARIICWCYLQNFPRFELEEIIVSGGGANNRALLLEIEQVMGMKPVLSPALGIPLQAKEPVGFGLLGELCLRGLAGNLPHATGAKESAILGKICPGRNWRALWKEIKL